MNFQKLLFICGLEQSRRDLLYNENPQFNWGFKKLKAMGRKNNLQSYNKVKVCQPNNKKQRRYRHEKRRYK